LLWAHVATDKHFDRGERLPLVPYLVHQVVHIVQELRSAESLSTEHLLLGSIQRDLANILHFEELLNIVGIALVAHIQIHIVGVKHQIHFFGWQCRTNRLLHGWKLVLYELNIGNLVDLWVQHG